MKTHSYPYSTYCLLFCLQAVVQGAEIPKLYNSLALNLGGAWDAGGAVPGAGDVMLWNDIYTIPAADNNLGAGILSQLAADISVAGLKVTNAGGTRNLATPGNLVGFRNTTPSGSAHTLTIGSQGIDMSTATQTLMIQSRVTLAANQPWNIGNANTNANPTGLNNNEDIAFTSQAAAVPFNFGGNTVTTSGAGQATIGQGYTLSNGTLEIGNNLFVIQGGASRVTTINDSLNLVVNAGTLRFQANSGAGGISLNSAAPITVNNGGTLILTPASVDNNLNQTGPLTLNGGTIQFNTTANRNTTLPGAVTVNGNITWQHIAGGLSSTFLTISGNISGSGNINYQNTATNTNGFTRLTGNNSGYSGTISLNGASNNRILRLSSANSGSAAATWNVGAANILQVDGVPVQLGTLNGGGTVTNSSTATPAALTVGAGLFSGIIHDGASQIVSLTKTGPGSLVLTGENNYTGSTTVSGGTLMTNTSQTSTGTVTIADGATFGTQVKAVDSTLNTGNVTVGSATGGSLSVDFGEHSNPSVAGLAVNELLLNGTSTLVVAGTNLSAGTFPVFQYTTLNGASAPISSLVLKLPTRTSGTLSEPTPGIVSVTISNTQQVKWDGDVSDNWDIDPDGSGSTGTANWRTTVTNADTRYIQGAIGTDVVTFDDSATGGGTVNLTASLAPLGLTVNNSTAKNYTFTGGGKITGFTGLEKSGEGMLTLSNTTPNDYSGGTVIHAGTLRLGDGVTAGAGAIAGAIDNSGTLVINRPDNHDFTNTLTGIGTLEKAQSSTLNFPLPTTLNHPLVITGGKVRFAAGGFLNDVVSGGGELETAATLELAGSSPNTHAGLTTVTAGALRLNKPAGVDAVGGHIAITGTGTVVFLNGENIPDSATVTHTGSSADCFAGSNAVMETFANAAITGPAVTPERQMILRAGQTITGTATVDQGILGVASAHTGTVNAVVLTSPAALLRVAGNTAASTLNIGTGGITASAGSVQVKFGTTNQDAILNLSGNVTTTGNFSFANGGYTGDSLNVIRLNGTRTFNIGSGTLTTVAPDIGDYIDSGSNTVPGTLVKTGDGAFVLDASSSATHTGGTTVAAGAMRVHGSLAGAVQVNAGASLGGNGTLTGAATVNGTITPGAAGVPAIGHLTSTGTVTFAPDSAYAVEIGNWIGINTVPGTDWDRLTVDSLAFTATPSNKLVIRVSGTPTDFTETNKTLVIATSNQPVTGFNAAAIQIDASGFPGTGTWAVQLNGNSVELVYTAGALSAYNAWATLQGLTPANNGRSQDPDSDGLPNFVEFALDGTALSGASSGKVVGKIATVGGEQVLTLTLPVRGTPVTTLFTGTTELTTTVDDVTYRIQASDGLDDGWNLAVTEVTGLEAAAIQTGLPTPLSAGWTYRTFRSPGPVTGDPREFMRVVVDDATIAAE